MGAYVSDGKESACDLEDSRFDPWDFPDSSVGIESTCISGDPGLIPGLGRFAGGR